MPKIIYLPDARLRAPTKAITQFDDALKALINEMYEIMDKAQGIGLAAPQIGLSLKLAVIDISEERDQRFCIVNPEIIHKEGEANLHEGCLSVPGVWDEAPRALKVTVKAQDEQGHEKIIEAEGLLAHCLQHEIDHLNGKLFVDYLSPLKKMMAKKKLEKFKRQQGR